MSPSNAARAGGGRADILLCGLALLAVAQALAFPGAGAAKERFTRFWNLTGNTVTQFALAPAGTTAYGPDQCGNDRDGTVDFDERLPLTNVRTGAYDVRLRLKKGLVCEVRGVQVREGDVFSIEEKDLVACAP